MRMGLDSGASLGGRISTPARLSLSFLSSLSLKTSRVINLERGVEDGIAFGFGCLVLCAFRIHVSVTEIEACAFRLGKVRYPVFTHAGGEVFEGVGDFRWDLYFQFWRGRRFGVPC